MYVAKAFILTQLQLSPGEILVELHLEQMITSQAKRNTAAQIQETYDWQRADPQWTAEDICRNGAENCSIH